MCTSKVQARHWIHGNLRKGLVQEEVAGLVLYSNQDLNQHGEATKDVCCQSRSRAAAPDRSKRYAAVACQRGDHKAGAGQVNTALHLGSEAEWLKFEVLRCPPNDYSRERGKSPKLIEFEEDKLYKSLVKRVPTVRTPLGFLVQLERLCCVVSHSPAFYDCSS